MKLTSTRLLMLRSATPRKMYFPTASQGSKPFPRGSKYPIFKDSGPQSHTLNGFWDQSS